MRISQEILNTEHKWKRALQWAKTYQATTFNRSGWSFLWETNPKLQNSGNVHQLANFLAYEFRLTGREVAQAVVDTMQDLYRVDVSIDIGLIDGMVKKGQKLGKVRKAIIDNAITYWIGREAEIPANFQTTLTVWGKDNTPESDHSKLLKVLGEISHRENEMPMRDLVQDIAPPERHHSQSLQSTINHVKYYKLLEYKKVMDDMRMMVVPLQGTLEDLKLGQLRLLELRWFWEDLRKKQKFERLGSFQDSLPDIASVFTNYLKQNSMFNFRDVYFEELSPLVVFGMFLRYQRVGKSQDFDRYLIEQLNEKWM